MDYPPVFTIIFLKVFVISAGLTGVMYWLAQRLRLLPGIRERDVHTTRKPRVGGIAMWLSVIIGFFLIILNPATADVLKFGNQLYGGIDQALWGILAGMLVILVVGLLDDVYSLSPAWQLVGQFAAALALVIFGVGIDFIRLPFDQILWLDKTVIHLGSIALLPWSAVFTIFWVMMMMNVINLFDGLDGLAGSVTMTAALVLVFVSLRVGFLATAALALVLFGSAAGFLPWNWHPSKIFMGTVGSQLLGFLLGVIAIISGGKLATAVLVLGIPLFDAIIVVIRRLLAGESPFKADQRHLHHRLLKIGLPTPWVVIVINVVAVSFGLLAVRTQQSTTKGFLTLVLAGLMALFILATYILEQQSKKRVH